ncbi:hypothetical protein KIV56_05850 [Cryobacterium breve]|uniref:Carbohydrate kinase PfkB domain-containing protein n=1 Tax=Cryobacterium breve TaxID=1259258 RepID=A0ABY7NF24_9MICO|nr:PfkB family carbohydrate kinase [Cryobacterium breve]WBM80844.1 hypothetical protein KIV56_05850 [Cryobacterium breve]
MTDEQAGAQALQEEPGNPATSGVDQGEPQVVCFGETMGMFTPTSTTSLDIAEGFHLGVGGAESNMAAHLAELGHHVAWAGNVGQDPIGTKVITTLDCGGVDTRWVHRTPASPTGLYLKEPDTGSGAHVFYYRAGSAASELGVADAAAWPLQSAHLIHTSGITPSLSPSLLRPRGTRARPRGGVGHLGVLRRQLPVQALARERGRTPAARTRRQGNGRPRWTRRSRHHLGLRHLGRRTRPAARRAIPRRQGRSLSTQRSSRFCPTAPAARRSSLPARSRSSSRSEPGTPSPPVTCPRS